MNPPPNREVALFSAALELDVNQRGPYLDKNCSDDPALRQRLEELLRVHDDAITFLENKAPAGLASVEAEVADWTTRPMGSPAEKPRDHIGRYKLLQKIGEGGCGVVYVAEQQEPVRRLVALKLIKLGMDTRQVIARFEAERQALALMDHPNIAKVFDAGATETGRPFFVMELVRGIKITNYCDENHLSTDERLDLFVQVCQAIQHAHQKGIIHRDIKPSNILVTISEPGGPGCPKIIDFGIAKATAGQQLTDKTVFTAFEQFIGTPAYMSPEQATMTALDIDTRSDIYSVGVLLYELLTGKTPLDQKELLAAGLEEMRRTIREKEPVRPSTRLSTMLESERTTTARHRHTDAPKLIHLLRGDLDWIVMKCLEKDRARRYETANGLARDVQRYLADEPVVARPPSNLYRLQKLARRNKLAFAAAGAVAAALLVGLAVSTWLLIKEREARQTAVAAGKKARTEAGKATAISDFLQQMLGSANPEALKGSGYTVRQLLDDFSAGLTNQLRDPEVEAAVRATMGRAYFRLGVYEKAQAHHERALALRRSLLGNQPEQVAESLVDNAWVCYGQNQWGKGETYAREALDIYRKRGTGGQPVISALWVLLKLVGAQERSAEVDAIVEEALKVAAKEPGIEFPQLASIIHGQAEAKKGQSKFAEAETLALKALAMDRRLRREDDIETGWALVVLGDALKGQSKLDEAEGAYQKALGIFRKQYTFGHMSVDSAMRGLTAVLEAKGDPAGLVAFYERTLADQRAALGNDSSVVMSTLCDLGAFLKSHNRPEEAARVYRETVGLGLDPRAEDLVKLPTVLRKLVEAVFSRGGWQDAESLYEDAIKVVRQKLGESHPALGTLLFDFSNLLTWEGKLDAATDACLQALQIRRATKDDNLAPTLRLLGQLQLRAGKPKDAERSLRESLEVGRALRQQEDYRGTAWLELADALLQQRRLPEAEQCCRDAVAEISKFQGTGREYYYRHAVLRLIRVLKTENKLAEAESCLDEVLSRGRHATVAEELIWEALISTNKNWPDDAETCAFLLRRGSEILQKVTGEELLEVSPWAISGLMAGGYRQQATNIYWRMLDSSSTTAGWFNGAAWYLATAENPSGRDPAMAVELAKRSVKLGGDWNTLGVARYRAGDFKQALADLQKCESVCSPQDVGSSFDYFFMAMAHHHLGDPDAARRCYDQAIKWMKENRPQDPQLIRFRAETEALLGAALPAAESKPEEQVQRNSPK